jgi:acyl-CoA reductase-like NAD-dependent aldehyde dehydrogenase
VKNECLEAPESEICNLESEIWNPLTICSASEILSSLNGTVHVPVTGVEMLQSMNPATGDVIESFDVYTVELVDEILACSRRAFEQWRLRPFQERSRLMTNAASVLRENSDGYAEIISHEMGNVNITRKTRRAYCLQK